MNFLYAHLKKVIELYVPVSNVSKKCTYPSWVSSDLKMLIRDKKIAHGAWKASGLRHDYLAFSNLRAKCKQMSNLDYLRHITSVESNISRNVKSFWSFVNSRRSNEAFPSYLNLDGVSADNSGSIADLFATYFQSVYRDTSGERLLLCRLILT